MHVVQGGRKRTGRPGIRDHIFSYRKFSGSRSQIYIADTGGYTDTAQVAIRVTPVAAVALHRRQFMESFFEEEDLSTFARRPPGMKKDRSLVV